jgi:hypothetical protein
MADGRDGRLRYQAAIQSVNPANPSFSHLPVLQEAVLGQATQHRPES